MKTIKLLTCFLFAFVTILVKAQEKKVLVFHKTEGFYHKSIPTGIQTIEDLAEKNGFTADETDNSEVFTKEDIHDYDLIVFLNTTGNILNKEQEEAFEDYIEKGGSFFGIHSAADTEFDWEWYGKLVGAYFKNHPKVQFAEIKVEMPDHPTVAHLPQPWKRKDEWYNYKNLNSDMNVLLRLDESSYTGGENDGNHPIAWYRELESGGRAVYTGGGHTIESYMEPLFVEHLLRSILFALKAGE